MPDSMTDLMPAIEFHQEEPAPAIPAEPQETAVETELAAESKSEPEAAAPESADVRDNEVAKLIRELRTARPEADKLLKSLHDSYFGHNAYKQLFPSVDEGRALKAQLEAVGGADGLAKLQDLESDIQEMYGSLERGDPAVLDEMIAEYPDGMKTLLAAGFERLAQLDPQAYWQSLQRPMAQYLLQDSGLAQSLGLVYERLQNNEADGAMKELQRIGQWLQGMSNLPERPTPQTVAADQDRQKWQAEREQMVKQQAGRELFTHLDQALRQQLEPLWKNHQLSDEAKNDLLQGVLIELDGMMKSDPLYQRNTAAYLKQGDVGKFMNFAKSSLQPQLGKAVNAVWNRRYGSLPARRQTATPKVAPSASAPAAPTNGAPVFIPQKPVRADIDYDKTTLDMMLRQQAYLKSSGKLVTWRQ